MIAVPPKGDEPGGDLRLEHGAEAETFRSRQSVLEIRVRFQNGLSFVVVWEQREEHLRSHCGE